MPRLNAREPAAREIQRRDDQSKHEVQQRQSPSMLRRHRGEWRERIPLRVDLPLSQKRDGEPRNMDRWDVQQLVKHRYATKCREDPAEPPSRVFGQR